jgi:predicted nucleic acid-binding Zn ribbon protein
MEGPEAIGKIVADLMATSGLSQRKNLHRIWRCWSDMLGGEVSAHTRLAGMRKNVLYVEVDSAPLLQELSAFHKGRLLSGLKEASGAVPLRDIRFRLGSF